MTEIMPVPRNLILLSYQQGASTGRFFVALRRNLSIFSHCVNGVCPAVGGRAEKGV